MRQLLKKGAGNRPFIMAIESSCDDTCLSILRKDNKVMNEFKVSQKQLHQPFGGIVPQIASSGHRKAFLDFLKNRPLQSLIKKNKIDLIAVTMGPGIGSCLKIGFEVGSQLAQFHNIPLLPINHLLGHLLSVDHKKEQGFPRLSLIVSGGNTQLVYSRSIIDHYILGLTIDDALGEAIDKSARLLNCAWSDVGGLGKDLEQMASSGTPVQFNTIALENYKDPLSFSFSGLKTALKTFIGNQLVQGTSNEDLASTIQNVLFGHVIDRVENCLTVLNNAGYKISNFSLIGGVASNYFLRNAIEKKCREFQIPINMPEMKLCTDNALMIGIAANKLVSFYKNSFPDMKLKRINSEWNLEELAINKYRLE